MDYLFYKSQYFSQGKKGTGQLPLEEGALEEQWADNTGDRHNPVFPNFGSSGRCPVFWGSFYLPVVFLAHI